MTTFHTLKTNCPCCSQEIEVRTLMSTNTFSGQYTDFHTVAVGFPPVPLMMNICPNCGFSGYADDFERPNALSDDLRGRVLSELQPLVRQYEPDSILGYEFTARIREWQGAPALQIADFYLHAAWCCLDLQKPEKESSYRSQAITFFELAFKNGQVPLDLEPNITYLVGELYRRIGNSQQAAAWFDKVIDRAQDHPDWEAIEWLAKQQRDNPEDRFER